MTSIFCPLSLLCVGIAYQNFTAINPARVEIFFVYEKGSGKWLFCYKIKVYKIQFPINLNFKTTQNIFATVLQT